MGIVKLQPDVSVPNEATLPQAIQEPNKSIFTSLVPESRITSLLKYVEGYPWTVNYYGQILNRNNTLENIDPSTPNLTQPYYEVNGLILQVSSPLSSSYDQASGITTVTGSALTPYTLIPNVGDIFIASVDSGEDAVFTVNSVSRKTFRKDTIYEISYNLYGYTSENSSLIESIKNRVQDTYYFNKDTNFFNRDVLIKPTVKEAIDRLNSLLRESKEYYFLTFAQKEAGTIYIPGLLNKLYDPLLLNFISKIVDYSDLSCIPFFRHNYANNKYINQKSILDLILARNLSLINSINKKYVFIPSNEILNNGRLGTVFYTGGSYILFPKEPNLNTDIEVLTYPNVSYDFIEQVKSSKNYFVLDKNIRTINNNNLQDKKLLHELFLNDSYIVSDNFYSYINDNSTYNNISYMELLIYKYLKREAIAKEDLVIVYETDYTSWSLLHQLYLLPVLWVITQSTL